MNYKKREDKSIQELLEEEKRVYYDYKFNTNKKLKIKSDNKNKNEKEFMKKNIDILL
ncbi:hypothetical protein [Intestinibacter sp.]